MKNALIVVPLLAAGVLASGCAASSSSSAAPPASASASATFSSDATGAPSPVAPGASAASASASSSPAGTPACTSADLQASLGGGAGTGMSQNRTGLQLRNVGSSACTLYGYPGVSWVAGADGHQVGSGAVREPNASGGAEKTVTLAPRATASAPLDIVDAAVIPTSECKPVPVRGLRIYPPGEHAALFIPLPTGAGQYGECSLSTKQATLSIGYLEPGIQPGGGAAG